MSDPLRRGARRRGPVLALAIVTGIFAFGSPAPAVALAPGSEAATASATQDGWWSRYQGPTEAEPEGNPLRPVLPTAPPPPTVPEDALAVAAAHGEPVVVSAVGLRVAVPEGGTVESLTLTLTEVEDGTVAAAGAKVLACPATTPWGPAKNADWRDRPEADCSLARAEGAREDDGTWVFDLTTLAHGWADPIDPLAQYGVVLVLDPETSPTAQVAWQDLASSGVAVELVATVVPKATPPASAEGPTPAAAEPPGPSVDTTPPPEPAPPPDSRSRASDPLAFPTGQPTFGQPPVTADSPAEPATTPGVVAAPRSRARPTGTQEARPAVGFWDGLPPATLLAVPVALGLALLVGLALGPAGRPSPSWPRAGGLTRALTRRSGGDALA